jgi:hypothetical protein
MDFSSFRRCLWKAVRYLASLIPGLLVIGGFVYVYVILQWDLVTHSGAYWTLVGCTVAFSSWCSLLESALMTINSEQFVLSFQASWDLRMARIRALSTSRHAMRSMRK